MRTDFLRFLRQCLKYRYKSNDSLDKSFPSLLRRSFLKTACISSAFVISDSALAKVPLRQAKIAVIGAGVSGLLCAYRLKRHGVSSMIFEAQSQIGGRMLSAENALGLGEVIELGGELVDSGHENLIALVKELGLHLTDLHQVDQSVIAEDWFFGGERYSKEQLIELFEPIAHRIEVDLSQVDLDTVSYQNPLPAAVKLDQHSIVSYLATIDASPTIKQMLALAYTTEYGLEASVQSATNLLYLIGTERDTFDVYGESDEHYHITEGSGAVPKRLARKLKNQIYLGHALEKIIQAPSGQYQLFFANQPMMTFDYIICTIPFSSLRKVDIQVKLPDIKRKAIAELGYGANSKLMVALKDAVWRERHGYSGNTFTDCPFQTTWETSRGQKTSGAVLTRFTGGDIGMHSADLSLPEDAKQFITQFEKLYPGVSQSFLEKAVRMHWPTRAYQWGSYACYLVGQFTGLRGSEGEAVGHFYFAGEHTSLLAQGYMEGAVESGERVAKEVLADLSIG